MLAADLRRTLVTLGLVADRRRALVIRMLAPDLRRIVVILGLVAAGLCAGCSDESSTAGPDNPPSACFRIYMSRSEAVCPLEVWFDVVPFCTEDDHTPYDDLQVRWDYGDDGVWDTGFAPPTSRYDGRPASVHDPVWRVRCEVRDAAGNTAQARDSVVLHERLPPAPDIMAGRLRVTLEHGCAALDTVYAGEAFEIGIYERCWMDASDEAYETDYLIDGEVEYAQWGAPSRPFGCCSGHGKCCFTIDTPGAHEIRVVLDAGGAFAETDETNNTATKTLIVLPRPPGS